MTITVGAIVAIAIVFLSLYLKTQQKEIAVLFIVSGVLFLFFVVLKQTGEALYVIREISQKSSFREEIEIMIKALGIAATAQVTADICRTAGENALAGQVELIGKTEILLLSLPLATRLFAVLQNFMQ